MDLFCRGRESSTDKNFSPLAKGGDKEGGQSLGRLTPLPASPLFQGGEVLLRLLFCVLCVTAV
jgi:hypothetical protein